MKNVLMLAFLLFLGSCSNGEKRKIVALLQDWTSHEIKFPADLIFTIQGRDTVDFPMCGEFKVVSYVDSIGCTDCKMQLFKWNKFVAMLDSAFSKKVSIYMILNPKSLTDIKYILRRDGFKYPVCIDLNDSFNKLNRFPSNIAFQTFLLDENNKVLAIGNPIHNPKIKELYLNIIQGKKDIEGEKTLRTEINIEEPLISLGRFNWKEERKATFKIENIGKHPLVINDVTTSCGCTSVDYSKEPVRPGDSISLQVTYKADHPEHFDKTITVYCNANPSLVHLKIMGDAE